VRKLRGIENKNKCCYRKMEAQGGIRACERAQNSKLVHFPSFEQQWLEGPSKCCLEVSRELVDIWGITEHRRDTRRLVTVE
jgi:hypothetical protein